MTGPDLRAGEHWIMPWANGGGRTLEVARCPAGSGPFD